MARLKAVDDANSVLTAILYAADANMHITTGSGAGQGFPTAGDWLMRIQYATTDPAYDVTKEQWEIVRATLRPATAHPADADTINITRVREGADAPTDWPVGSVVYNVFGQDYLTELQAEIDLKMSTASDAAAAVAAMGVKGDANPLHHDKYTLPDEAVTNAKLAHMATKTFKGRLTAATGDAEDLTPMQAFNVIESGGAVAYGNTGATPTFTFANGLKVTATVDASITSLSITDPGYNGVFTLILTKSADATERTILYHDTGSCGADEAANWVGNGKLTTMGIISGQRMIVKCERFAANLWAFQYVDWGVAP